MSDEAELKKARFYALKVSNLRPRSVEELKEKLRDKGFTQEVIDGVISEFAKKGVLNDSKFSKLWVESRMASNPKGASVLKQELKSKGVEDKTIESVLQAANKEYDEYKTVKELAEKRMFALRDLDKKTAKRRLFGYLKRRGFSFETIMKVMGENFR